MDILHLTNSAGLLLAAVVMLMALTGEVGMTVGECLSGRGLQRR